MSERRPGGSTEEILSAAAHAKVNLRLRVFGPDDQGYHSIETLFLRTGLHDTLELAPAAAGISLQVEGDRTVPEGPDNLCWQAAQRFFAAIGREPAVRVRLAKRIPSGSGLGGGSSDAAAVLRLLNGMHGEPLAARDLVSLGGSLGSDVPFFVLGVPMALGWERGRRLMPLRPPRRRPVLLVVPDFRVGSGEAYGWLREAREREAVPGEVAGHPDSTEAVAASAGALPGAGRFSDWSTLARIAVNDFEGPVFERYPELREARDRLLAAGADVSLLTGSGSAVFGVFPDTRARDAACDGAGWPPGWTLVPTEMPV